MRITPAAAGAPDPASHNTPSATAKTPSAATTAAGGPDPASHNTPSATPKTPSAAAGVSAAAAVNTPTAASPPAAAAGGGLDPASHNTPAAAPIAPSPAAAAVNTPIATPPPEAATAGPPTPLEQRQWQRLAQRSIRLAVTAFKDAETRVLEATTQGTALATKLTNSMLSERYIPSIELPDVLKGVDGLQRAAILKLQRQQHQLLQQLEAQLLVITDAVQDMEAAVADISSNLQSSSSWQHSMAVFHTLALPDSRDLLLQIAEMYKLEVASKQGLLESYKQFIASSSSSSSKSTNSRLNSSSLGFDDLRKVLTVAVTTWMVRPYVDLETCQQLLQVLTDEMVGF